MRWFIDSPYRLKELWQYLSSKKAPYVIEVCQPYKQRSTTQNRLYWAWLGCISADTGYHVDDLHEMFKREFLEDEEVHVLGKTLVRPRSTKSLSNLEFTEYLNAIKKQAMEIGVWLPSPGEPDFDEFMTYYSKNLRKIKQ